MSLLRFRQSACVSTALNSFISSTVSPTSAFAMRAGPYNNPPSGQLVFRRASLSRSNEKFAHPFGWLDVFSQALHFTRQIPGAGSLSILVFPQFLVIFAEHSLSHSSDCDERRKMGAAQLVVYHPLPLSPTRLSLLDLAVIDKDARYRERECLKMTDAKDGVMVETGSSLSDEPLLCVYL